MASKAIQTISVPLGEKSWVKIGTIFQGDNGKQFVILEKIMMSPSLLLARSDQDPDKPLFATLQDSDPGAYRAPANKAPPPKTMDDMEDDIPF